MGEVIHFKHRNASERHKGKTMCRNNHHKWRTDKTRVFDVKQGRLVTRYECIRCGAIRTKAE